MDIKEFGGTCVKIGGVCVSAAVGAIAVISIAVLIWVSFI